jgi:molybdopterin molybdotransferase
VIRQPRIAILSTGDELVPTDQVPGPGQIRNSNGPMLAAAARRAGAVPRELGVARDQPQALREKIADGLGDDIFVLSGGVSAGVHDLAPGVFADLHVEQVFHKVRLKPGKPLWFGVQRRDDGTQTLVFGLPGNPVSTLVCFELFVRPAINALLGRAADIDRLTSTSSVESRFRAKLTSAFSHRGERPTLHPAIWRSDDGTPSVEPVCWFGSADLRGLTAANALIHFPAGDRDWPAGETVEILVL